MDDEKKMCQNCKRDIPSTNYEMHTVHCQRNIQLCATCDEPVPRSEMENHKKEFHAIIACPECRERMECSKLENHKENLCSHRSVPCQYCDLELKADGIPEHENYCGSRTEDCEECGKIFMLKNRDFHLNSDHRLTQPREEVSSDSDNDIEDVEEIFPHYSARFRRGSVTTGRENHHSRRTVPYENSSRRQGRNSLNDIELDEYFGNMGIENIGNLPGLSFQATANRPRANRAVDATYIPCEFCEVPIIADELVLHQTGCRPDLVSHQSPTASNATESWAQRVRRDNVVHEISDDDDDDDVQYIDHRRENEVLIPCEFCDRHFSLDAVSHHQITCGNNQAFGHEVYD